VSSVRERWEAWSPAARLIAVLVGVLVVANIGAGFLDRVLGGGPSGPSSSSYATSSGGLAAYADLLGAQGTSVTRLRTPLDKAHLDPGSTLVLVDTPLPQIEEATVEDFVRQGGRLVAAGAQADGVVASLADSRARWSDEGAEVLHPVGGEPETAGVRRVEASGNGSWSFVDNGELAGEGNTVVFADDVERGRVVAIADSSILSNDYLDRADNAAFAIAAAGPRNRPVVFAEYGHGYGHSSGLGAIPTRWKAMLIIAALAAVVAMWARGKRLGPPDRDDTVRPPPRVAYVEAVAATIARAGDREEGVRPVRAQARALVLARAGLPVDAVDDEVRRAASATGVPAATVEAVLRPVTSDDDVVAVGRALASLEEEQRW
jgi:hypothetical protein